MFVDGPLGDFPFSSVNHLKGELSCGKSQKTNFPFHITDRGKKRLSFLIDDERMGGSLRRLVNLFLFSLEGKQERVEF